MMMPLLSFAMMDSSETEDTHYILFSVGGGIFTPNDKNYTSNGKPNLSLSYVEIYGDYFGLGIDIDSYSAERSRLIFGYDYKERHQVIGIDLLYLIQPNKKAIQPYVGMGFGLFTNKLSVKYNGETIHNDSGSALGLVGKVGLRAFLTDYLYVGGAFKYFTNNQKVKDGGSFELGGTIYTLELGVRF